MEKCFRRSDDDVASAGRTSLMMKNCDRKNDVGKILVLGLGNEIMGDDAIGIVVARALKRRWSPAIEVAETSVGGFALLDLLDGHDTVLLVDAIVNASVEPGSIIELTPADIDGAPTDVPHFASLADVIRLAKRLEIPFPSRIRFLGVAVEDVYVIREGLSDCVASRVEDVVRAAEAILDEWGLLTSINNNSRLRTISHTLSGC